MDIRDLDKDELARMIFSGFHHYWNMEACRKVAGEIVEKEWGAEEIIEVGDDITVKQHPCLNNDTVCEVVGEDEEKFHLRTRDILYSWKDVDTRTLIRKGPKEHRFEGIFWREKNVEEADCHNNQSACIPHVPCERAPLMGLRELCDNGKIYDMILRERPDVS